MHSVLEQAALALGMDEYGRFDGGGHAVSTSDLVRLDEAH